MPFQMIFRDCLRILYFVVWLSGFFLQPTALFACEPCVRILPFEETARQADLIVIGQRTNYSPTEAHQRQGPDEAEIRVIRVLKGNYAAKQLRADAWYGMCAYGLAVDDKLYVMFLSRKPEGYRTVDGGCSLHVLPVEDNTVLLNKLKIPMVDFEVRLHDLQVK